MKIATLFGTRPEIIRLSRIIERLDRHTDQTLIHTGQNYDPGLSDVFFADLGVRAPDMHLGVEATVFADQVGTILARAGEALRATSPDALVLLGDTNSALSAIVAARMGIPVYHLEAGNRCYDDRVPEEINRRLIDHCSAVLLPYTKRSMQNLLREGIDRQRIFVTGNPIYEVLEAYAPQIERSDALARLDLPAGTYFLVTLHRAENVDDPERLGRLFEALSQVAERFDGPVVCSVHPRTRQRLREAQLNVDADRVRLMEPFGYFDFVALEKSARCVLTDSGTVQEECCIFGIPNVTLRDVTERPETIEVGSNIVTGADPATIVDAVELALDSPGDWIPPIEYRAPHVSRTVVNVIKSYRVGA